MAEDNQVETGPSITAVFRRAREAAGLKQEDVIGAVPGLTQSTYSRFELGQANLAVTDIVKISEFLNKHQRKKASGLMKLSSLLRADPEPPSFTQGTLIEQITRELQYEADMKEAREWDRLMDEELPALRKKVAHDERLLRRDTEAIRGLMAENKKLKAENAALRARKNNPKKSG